MLEFFGENTVEIAIRFAIDLIVMLLLIFGLCYRRYRDKELATTAALFNVFAFSVLTILSRVQFSLAAGFGLFAILALFSLRSEQIGKIDISYFFGSIAIAVICSVAGTTIGLVCLVSVVVLIAAWAIDHPAILQRSYSAKITLDKIEDYALSNPDRFRKELSTRLGVEVMAFQIMELNYVNDLARVNVYYNQRQGA